MSIHPRMLYRPGSAFEWAGKSLEYRIVNDGTEEAQARANGWRTAEETLAADPLDHDGDGQRGGSLPGEASTRAKGARNRKGVK